MSVSVASPKGLENMRVHAVYRQFDESDGNDHVGTIDEADDKNSWETYMLKLISVAREIFMWQGRPARRFTHIMSSCAYLSRRGELYEKNQSIY